MTVSILDDLRTDGWSIRHQGPAPKRFQVMGERSSGTNFIKRLIDGNSGLANSDVLGWKHGVPAMLAIPGDLVVVCVFRGAEKWALSMHAKPWHCRPPMQEMAFSDFIRAPWDTRVDRPRYFPWADGPEYRGQDLQADRHPITGDMYRDLFELRAVKMAALLGFANRHPNVVFVRLEAVQAAPEAFLAGLAAGLGFAGLSRPYQPVTKRLGAKFKPAVAHRPLTPEKMPEGDRDWMMSRLDQPLETAMGYHIQG
ncbi:hypothetical protein Q4577_10670 [Marinovum sp. 2_MG-2023]|uniref:hypothetical protein n=1 Tax=unclassified Marinovum TaxID=2647166 RepID=UPI0026E4807F|nr:MULTISPECIES: hypothetical protein [unclassified Marinovum]MDO6730483.1 hypothetical protein [Marinovum sp. 2_MG-2023]MDO6778463.1 hypothetical protein [Marinovum sp. 1_MG-2023]